MADSQYEWTFPQWLDYIIPLEILLPGTPEIQLEGKSICLKFRTFDLT